MSEPNGRPNIASNQLSRRQILKSANTGFGYLALASLLRETAPRMASASQDSTGHRPLAPKPPQFPVKAKRIIFLFMEGAASQMDTWDYKPKLQEDDGKVGPGGGTLTASKFKFAQHGQTGTWISELYPNVAQHVDKLCFLRGLHTDTPAHPQAVIQLHTGAAQAQLTRPSMGAWLMYGLGTENQDLPGFIAALARLGYRSSTRSCDGAAGGAGGTALSQSIGMRFPPPPRLPQPAPAEGRVRARL